MMLDEYELMFDPYMQQRQINSHFRVLHASPGAPPVDIFLNNLPISRNLAYRGFTEYLPTPSGTYNIKVFRTGTTTNPLIDTNWELPPRTIFTVAVIGTPPNLSLLPVPEPKLQSVPGRVNLRFAHLSPNTPAVDVALPNGNIIFRDIQYREHSDYITVRPGTYTIYVRPTGTTQNVLYVPNIRLQPNRFYTIYAVGLAGGNPPLQVLIPLDGNSYINP